MGHEMIALWTEMSSDPELIAGVRAGDTAAFGVLYERHADAARKVAAQYTNTPVDIDDVVSESFSRVLRALQQGDGPDLAFRAYLFTIVRRTGMDIINKGIRTKPRDDMSPYEAALGYEAPSDEPAMEGFEHGLVADAFKSLPERWQAVLWYTEVEKKSPKEIAPLLGLSANGVAALSYRAREALRQAYLQQHLSSTIDTSCLEANAQLGAFVRGGLNRREATRVDEHVRVCEKCAALVAELEDVNRGMRGIIAPLILGALGMGALEGGLPIGGIFGIGAAAGAAATSGAASSGTAGSGAAGTGAAGSGAAGSGVGAAASAGGVTAGLGAAGLAALGAAVTTGAAGPGAIAAAAAAAAQTAAATLASTPWATAEAAVGSNAAAPWATEGSGIGHSAPAGNAAATSAGSGSSAPWASAANAGGGSAAAQTAADAATSSAGVKASAGVSSGSGTGGGSSIFAGVGSLIIPIVAVAGVASLALAGANYFGVFNGSSTDPVSQAQQQIAPSSVEPSAGPSNPLPSESAPSPEPSTTQPDTGGAVDGPGTSTGTGTGTVTRPSTGTGTGTITPPVTPPSTGTGTGTDPGTGGSTTSAILSLAKAPLDFLEIPQSRPALNLQVSNTGDADSATLEATIVLPAGLTFSAPAGGAAPLMPVNSDRLSNFLSFGLEGQFSAGDWTCERSTDAATADCTLETLTIGSNTRLDLDLTITGVLANDALTSFTVVSGDQNLSYSVLTGIETNEENVDIVYATEGQVAATHVGATLLGCDLTNPACAAIMASSASSTKGEVNNNGWTMEALNEAGGVRNSAATTLTLPAGSIVKYATLEWAANRYTTDAFNGALDSARLRAPGGEYFDITADSVTQSTDPAGRIYYQSRLNITDLVKANGAGSWALADVALPSTQLDPDWTYVGGFAITVVYEDPSLADSRVAIFDGAEWVSANNKSDFTFATTDTANVTVGWTSFEGDRGMAGDQLDVDGVPFTPLRWNGTSTAVGQSNNAADATAFGGIHANTMGIDAKMFNRGSVAAGVHAITVRTTGDNFLLSTLTVTISYE